MPHERSPSPTAGRTDRELIESAGRELDGASVATGSALHLPAGAPLPDCLKDELEVTADSIPGYSIVGEIHRGGQGVVYQAVQKTTRRKVAIKVMREGPFAGKHDKARFEREVQVLAAVKHPNIVAIHESGTAAGSFYFVMDYVSGQPLDVYMAAAQRSVRGTLALFRKICEAVNAAHLRGVIHRDLKPGNIRIDPEGEPQILDFGLAKVAAGEMAGETPTMTVTGQFVGSMPWASPEQAEGMPSKIDIRTDVYSLGVVLYQMLTGKFPYDVVGGFREVLDRIMTVPPVRPRMLRKDIDDEVETIVLKALAKERERRYQSAGELARDVGHYLAGEPIEAKRDSSWYLLRKNLYRHRAPVAVGAGFVLLLAAGLVASLTLWQRSVHQRDEAEAQRLLAQHRLFDGLIEAADSRVKSKQFAEARRTYCEAWDLARQIGLPDLQPRMGWLNSYMISPPPLSVHDLGGQREDRPPRSTVLCMSKDGPLVAVQRQNVVYLYDPVTGRQSAALVGHTGPVRGLAVSPDGRQFLTGAGGQDRTVRLWDAASQKELRRVEAGAAVIKCAFSPDGRAGYWSEDDGKVTRWDLATGEPAWVVKTGIPELHLYPSPDPGWLGGGGPASALIDAHAGRVVRPVEAWGALAFSSDGTRVLSGHKDKSLRLWDVATGHQIKRFPTGSGMALSLAISADGRMVLEGQDDLTIKLWELETGNELASWSGHTASVDGVAFLSDGRTAVTCSVRECLLWNIPLEGGARSFRGQQPAGVIAISPDGRTALSSGANGLVLHWDIATAKVLAALAGHTATVSALAFLPDGTRALSAAGDSSLRLWDLSTGTQLGVLGHHRDAASNLAVPAVSNLAISPDGGTALSSAFDGSLWLWDLRTLAGHVIRAGGEGAAHILSICFSADGRWALTGHRGGNVVLWDLQSGTEERRFIRHQDSVNGVAFLPDGRTGLSASADSLLIVWDLDSGKAMRWFYGAQGSWVSKAALAPDGQTVYCGSFDGTIRLWSIEAGKQLCALTRHAAGINSLDLSRDGRVLLSASVDGAVSIWDFDLPQKYRELEPRAVAARERLILHPQDAQALLTLGEWFAFREADHLAANYLERGRKAGAAVSPLLLGRCYWRLGRIDDAQQEFERALRAREAPDEYLERCLQALSRPPLSHSQPPR
jgi:WD40 repeat protein/tRNA A-37 threonylcarbamoyl transferase component Bud32